MIAVKVRRHMGQEISMVLESSSQFFLSLLKLRMSHNIALSCPLTKHLPVGLCFMNTLSILTTQLKTNIVWVTKVNFIIKNTNSSNTAEVGQNAISSKSNLLLESNIIQQTAAPRYLRFLKELPLCDTSSSKIFRSWQLRAVCPMRLQREQVYVFKKRTP